MFTRREITQNAAEGKGEGNKFNGIQTSVARLDVSW